MARPIDPNLKIQLLAAAEAEFVRHGLESARVDDIVARAGRSKGSFYQYFESKDQVFRDLIENLPLNGRSFQSLIALTPGIVLAKATFGEQGQFSVNGLALSRIERKLRFAPGGAE